MKHFKMNADYNMFKCFQYLSSKSSCIKFWEPVYMQRYYCIRTILEKMTWNKQIKVADYGCNKLGFFECLKYLDFVEEIFEIDIDRDTLLLYKEVVEPEGYKPYNKILRRPLRASILVGNVAMKDMRLKDVDAVICSELIEHLSEQELRNFPSNIFGFIKPKVAIFTTPNVEFNVLFEPRKKFRHCSHTFEWTRLEFDNWANEILKQYPEYNVKFYGIGPGPNGTEHLGYCSQMAVFSLKPEFDYHTKKVFNPQHIMAGNYLPYDIITSYEFQWNNALLSNEDHILKEVCFQVEHLKNLKELCTYTKEHLLLSDLMPRVKNWCRDMIQLELLIKKSNLVTLKHLKNGLVAIVF